jgi:hypothetical protein
MVTWLKAQLPPQTQAPWLAVDGFYAKREFLKPARRAGFVVVARLRHRREETAGLPTCLRRLPGRAVRRDQILADQVTLQLLAQLRQRQF